MSTTISSRRFFISKEEKTSCSWGFQERDEVGDKLQRVNNILPVDVENFQSKRHRSENMQVKVFRARQRLCLENKLCVVYKETSVREGKSALPLTSR